MFYIGLTVNANTKAMVVAQNIKGNYSKQSIQKHKTAKEDSKRGKNKRSIKLPETKLQNHTSKSYLSANGSKLSKISK